MNRFIPSKQRSLSLQVILAVARVFYYVGPPSESAHIISPLLRLLHTSVEVERVAVEELYLLARDHPVSLQLARKIVRDREA